MFKKLSDFSYKRKGWEILGFYLAYFVLSLVIGGIAGALSSYIVGAQTFDQGYASGIKAGMYVAPLFVIVLTVLVIRAKKAINFGSILLGLLGILTTFVGGTLLGLIFVSILSARGK